MSDRPNRLEEAIKQVRLSREELNLHPKWDGALADAEIKLRGVEHYLEEENSDEIDPSEVL